MVFRCLQLLFRKYLLKFSHTLMYNSLTGKLVSSPFLLFSLVVRLCWGIFIFYPNFCWFCSLLLRRECCTFSNGEYVKSGLAELELWCCQAKEEVILSLTRYWFSSNESMINFLLLYRNLFSFVTSYLSCLNCSMQAQLGTNLSIFVKLLGSWYVLVFQSAILQHTFKSTHVINYNCIQRIYTYSWFRSFSII